MQYTYTVVSCTGTPKRPGSFTIEKIKAYSRYSALAASVQPPGHKMSVAEIRELSVREKRRF